MEGLEQPPGLWEMRLVQWRGRVGIIRSCAGSRVVQKNRKPSRRGSVFPGRCVTRLERVEGGPMEGARAEF
jgi:hypothetical protein